MPSLKILKPQKGVGNKVREHCQGVCMLGDGFKFYTCIQRGRLEANSYVQMGQWTTNMTSKDGSGPWKLKNKHSACPWDPRTPLKVQEKQKP